MTAEIAEVNMLAGVLQSCNLFISELNMKMERLQYLQNNKGEDGDIKATT